MCVCVGGGGGRHTKLIKNLSVGLKATVEDRHSHVYVMQ